MWLRATLVLACCLLATPMTAHAAVGQVGPGTEQFDTAAGAHTVLHTRFEPPRIQPGEAVTYSWDGETQVPDTGGTPLCPPGFDPSKGDITLTGCIEDCTASGSYPDDYPASHWGGASGRYGWGESMGSRMHLGGRGGISALPASASGSWSCVPSLYRIDGRESVTFTGEQTAALEPGCYLASRPQLDRRYPYTSTGTVALLAVGDANCGAEAGGVGPPDEPCPAPERRYGGPLARSAAGHGWRMSASISADDGLTVSHVKLGGRYMARKISLPYYLYGGIGGGGPADVVTGFGQLGTEGGARLLDFSVQEEAGALRVEARWIVEDLAFAGDSGTCLEIDQTYVFSRAVKGDHCEPTGIVPCARWRPEVSYRFHGPLAGPGSLAYVTLPQRLHFMPDAGLQPHEFSAGALARDHDTLDAGVLGALASLPQAGGDLLEDKDLPAGLDRITRAAVIADQLNPLLGEYDAQVISGGQIAGGKRSWDNYHQTRNQAVTMPRGLALDAVFDLKVPWPAPGCPECVHVHWRWGTMTNLFPGFEDHNGGAARVPPGSDQDVRIGIVKHRVEKVPAAERKFEEDPVPGGWEKLVNGEGFGVGPRPRPGRSPAERQQNQMVLWYDGTGYGPVDAFFRHGAFYSYDRPGVPQIREFKRELSAAGHVAVRFRLSEWCRVTLSVSRLDEVGGELVRTPYGDFVTEGDRSSARLLIPARNGKRRLEPGARYSVRLLATDVAGNEERHRPSLTFTAPPPG